METVRTRNGTTIAYERSGSGPGLVLVGGALSDRTAAAGLSRLLEARFSVIRYDRRGRGGSGDSPAYSIDREIDDLVALLDLADGGAFLYGHSSGAILALDAALSGLAIPRLALYEPPFMLPGTRVAPGGDLPERLERLVEAGDRDGAIRLFYEEAIDLPGAVIDRMQTGAAWRGARSLAHTLAYDTRIAGRPLPVARLASLSVPTLVIVGGASPSWMRASNEALASALPNAELRVLAGETHAPAPERLAAELTQFFLESPAHPET